MNIIITQVSSDYFFFNNSELTFFWEFQFQKLAFVGKTILLENKKECCPIQRFC